MIECKHIWKHVKKIRTCTKCKARQKFIGQWWEDINFNNTRQYKTISTKIDKHLADEFYARCKDEGVSVSIVLENLIREAMNL